MSTDQLWLAVLWYSAFLLSMVMHEAAHAWMAFRLGDDTAEQGGQVSLNPIPHVQREPVGTVVIPWLSFVLSGWMIGWASAPFNRAWALRYPHRLGWMSFAGPAANLVLVLVAAALIRLGLSGGWLVPPAEIGFSALVDAGTGWAQGPAIYLSILFSLNLILCAFNLMPVPPLDGASILTVILPQDLARRYLDWIHRPALMLVGLLIAWNLFGRLIRPLFQSALALLYS